MLCIYWSYLICLKHVHSQDESSSFSLDQSEVDRRALVEDGIFLPWCSSFPFTNLRTYIISYALKSELWIRLSGNGRKHFTSSFICNGISERPAPAFQSIRTWSKLQSCSFVPSKILKTDSLSRSTRTEPETLKTTFRVLWDHHGWFGFIAVLYHNLSRVL